MPKVDWNSQELAKNQSPVKVDWDSQQLASDQSQGNNESGIGQTFKNVIGGIVNPISNFANLGAEGERLVANSLGHPEFGLPNIPNIHTTGGASTLLGNLIGTIIPYTGATKLVRAAEAIPSIISGSEFLPANTLASNLSREALAGGLTGAASSNEGSRGSGAIGGAIGGSIGGALGSTLKPSQQALNTLDDIHENIANKYINLHNNANELYNNTANAAKAFDEMHPNAIETPEYNAKAKEILDSLESEKGAPSSIHDSVKKVASSIVSNPQDTVSGLLTERQKLNNILRMKDLDSGAKSKINELKSSVQNDLANLTNNVNEGAPPNAVGSIASLHEPYMQANGLWSQMKGLAGENQSKRSSDLLERLVGPSDFDENGNIVGNDLDREAFNKLYLSKPSTGSAVKNYENLVSASGLNKDQVSSAIKNEPFNNEVDDKAFQKFYKKVSKDKNAKDWLFSPEEQRVLNKSVNTKKSKFAWPLFIAAEGATHALGAPLMGATFPAYMAAKAGSRGLNKLLSREISQKMINNDSGNIYNNMPINNSMGTIQGRGLAPYLSNLGSIIGGNQNGN